MFKTSVKRISICLACLICLSCPIWNKKISFKMVLCLFSMTVLCLSKTPCLCNQAWCTQRNAKLNQFCISTVHRASANGILEGGRKKLKKNWKKTWAPMFPNDHFTETRWNLGWEPSVHVPPELFRGVTAETVLTTHANWDCACIKHGYYLGMYITIC